MSNNDCLYCNDPISGGVQVTTGVPGKSAHRHCYERKHPPMAAQSIYQMARGRGDPVLAAEVIAEMVPDDLANKIVDEFNKRLMLQWLPRCTP